MDLNFNKLSFEEEFTRLGNSILKFLRFFDSPIRIRKTLYMTRYEVYNMQNTRMIFIEKRLDEFQPDLVGKDGVCTPCRRIR
jgi:hypothetical protein